MADIVICKHSTREDRHIKRGKGIVSKIKEIALTSSMVCGLSIIGYKLYRGLYHNYRDFSGQDLSGRDFQGQNLSCANFTGCNLTGANFTGCNLTGANFYDAAIWSADFTGANLWRVRSGSSSPIPLPAGMGELPGTGSGQYQGQQGQFGTLAGEAELLLLPVLPYNWQYMGGYLIGPGANLDGANLDGANLDGANLDGANLDGADFSYAILTNATFSNVVFFNTLFINSVMNGVKFDNVQFILTLFKSVDLRHALFRRLVIRGALMPSFENGLYDVMMVDVDLRGASFDGFEWNATVFADVDVDGTYFSSTSIEDIQSSAIRGTPKELPIVNDGIKWEIVNGAFIRPIVKGPDGGVDVERPDGGVDMERPDLEWPGPGTDPE
jgi:uncharacterized protein YjbI with pentapeptide repeats